MLRTIKVQRDIEAQLPVSSPRPNTAMSSPKVKKELQMIKVLLLSCITTLALSLTSCRSNKYSFDRNKVADCIYRLVDEIEEINIVMGDAIGYGGERPKQYNHFMMLEKLATREELIELTNHPNPTVRCYAFWALSLDLNVDLYPIMLKHINDDEYVTTQFGCKGGGEKVGDFFVYRTQKLSRVRLDYKAEKLESKIDNLLLYTPNALYAKDGAIKRAKLTEELYPRLRKFYIEDSNQEALVKLAEYQKEVDVDLILKNKRGNNDYRFTYKAISKFPDPTFFPLLEKHYHSSLNEEYYSDWKYLYDAIIGYKNDKALELLRIPLSKFKNAPKSLEEHRNYISEALKECNSSFYNEFRKAHNL